MAEMSSVVQKSPPPRPRAGRRARQYALAGALFGAVFPIVATIVSLSSSGTPWSVSHIAAAHRGEVLLWIIDSAPLWLGLFAGIAGAREDALEAGNRRLMHRERDLAAIQATLEQRVEERTRAVMDRSLQMRSAVQAAKAIAQVRTHEELPREAAQALAQVLEGFAVDLYMLDETAETAVLAASSDIAPDTATGPSRAAVVGDSSLVGQVTARGQSVSSEPQQALKEIGLPLFARGRLLGALRFHATAPGASMPADIEVLQLLADQLASTLESSRLFEESRAVVDRLQALTSERTLSGWQEQLASESVAYQYTRAGVQPINHVSAGDDPLNLQVPLELRGQSIGRVVLKRSSEQRWSQAEREFAQKVASQVALAVENVRLIDETRRTALQQQTMSEFSARLSESVNIQSLLQTAVRELAALPDVADASVFLNPLTRGPDETAS
jgi:GAF domain-containing protein